MGLRSKILVWGVEWCFLCVTVSLAQPSDVVWYEVQVSKSLMGTHVEATVMHEDINTAKRALVAAFMEMERVEQLLSVHLETSDIAVVNQRGFTRPVRVQPETFAILERAVAYGQQFDGLFDVTVGPLTKLWGFNDEAEVVLPPTNELHAAKALVGFQYITLNEVDTTVQVQQAGMRIDLGGIAKGYAVDRAVAVLREEGVTNFLLNAGGDLYVAGEKQPGQAWKVGVKHPRETDTLLASISANNQAIATSGDYERFTEIDGQRYHHILDPRSGYPATTSQSATALASTVEEADVLATYLFITGELPPSHAFMHVSTGGDVQMSAGFEARMIE